LRWIIRLDGKPEHLAILEERFPAGTGRVFRKPDDATLYWESPAIQSAKDIESANRNAERKFSAILDAVSFVAGGRLEIYVRSIVPVRSDGGWDRAVAFFSGVYVPPRSAPLPALRPEVINVREARPYLAKAYFSDARSSTTLRKTFEALLLDVGPGSKEWITTQGWISPEDLEYPPKPA